MGGSRKLKRSGVIESVDARVPAKPGQFGSDAPTGNPAFGSPVGELGAGSHEEV